MTTTNTENTMPLEVHELLDRYEILYPDNTYISDLRRAYIDKDLSSIFRLSKEYPDLRSAVLDDNLHSIFRLLEPFNFPLYDDFRKAVIENNLHSLFRLFEHYTDTNRSDYWHIGDLKRAALEKNLYSLFRLFPEDSAEIDMLRTAIVNKNIRSIFKLLDSDDLRKLIVDNNTWKLWSLLESTVDTQFTAAFKNFFVNNTTIDTDSFSRGQLQSKLWLVKELKNLNITDLGTVFLCAGWYGILAVMLFEHEFNIKKVLSFDIDPTTVDIAEVFNKPWFMDKWKFKALVQNIEDINYEGYTWQYWSKANNRMSFPIMDTPDTIINTSCEHIANFDSWFNTLPKDKLLILQANNYLEVEEHVNIYNTLDEFNKVTPMNKVLFVGELVLEKYTRYMKIGIK